MISPFHILLPLSLAMSLFCSAQEVMVSNTDNAGSGSLREALEAVESGGVIHFDSSLDGGTITLEGVAFLLRKNVTIDASTLANGLTIDGASDETSQSRIFEVSRDIEVRLENLTLRNGATAAGDDGLMSVFDEDGDHAGAGGAIVNYGTLSLSGCTLADNAAGPGGNGGFGRGGHGGSGGAIWNEGELLLENCTLSGNSSGAGGNGGGRGTSFGGRAGSAGQGGAIANYLGATLTLRGCTFFENRAADGGVGGTGGGFFGNGGRAGWGGSGGAVSNQGYLRMINCTFMANSSGLGGIGGGSENNSAGDGGFGGHGGAIYHIGESFTMIHSTVTQNEAAVGGEGGTEGESGIRSGDTGSAGQGGGVYCETTATLVNNIVSGNTARTDADMAGMFEEQGNNITDSDSPILLRPLGDYGGPTLTMPPFATSRAVDASGGGSGIAVDIDQRGLSRRINRNGSEISDLGAVELASARDEFDLFFGIDSDGDGLSNGQELVRGTDPFVSDTFLTPNFRFLSRDVTSGNPSFTFAYRDADVRLQVTRSTDLINFGTVIADSADEDDFKAPGDDTLVVIDDESPPSGRAFYRLEVVRPD